MTTEHPIVLYDIASAPPRRTFAPNPWKTRFALNLKGVHYRTQWVDMPDITSVRQGLGVPANRTLPDGTPYHTLPVIQDPAAGKVLGDSFEIATYLDSAYPDKPSLFAPLTTGLTAAFNAHVDGIFTKFAGLCSGMPFDPRSEAATKDIFVRRAGCKSWDDLVLSNEQREGLLVGLEAALGELAKTYKHTGGTTDWIWRAGGTDKAQSQQAPVGREEGAPFLDGSTPVYADFIVGAWLKMMQASLPPADWERIESWHGGLWDRVVKALDSWAEIK